MPCKTCHDIQFAGKGSNCSLYPLDITVSLPVEITRLVYSHKNVGPYMYYSMVDCTGIN